MPDDIPENPDYFSSGPICYPVAASTGAASNTMEPGSSAEAPAGKEPDVGMLSLFVGILLGGFFMVLPMNHFELDWKWSVLAYIAFIIGLIWTFLSHGVPSYGKTVRTVGSIAIICIFGSLGGLGVHREYAFEHTPPAEIGSNAPKFLAVMSNDSYPFDLPITNGATLSLKQSRTFRIGLENVGTVVPQNVVIDFVTSGALGPTNLNLGSDWNEEPQAESILAADGKNTIIKTGFHWTWSADGPIAISTTNNITLRYTSPISILTNFQFPVVQAQVEISATGATNKNLSIINLTF